MRIAIISTMAGVPWGGSEELWFQVAKFTQKEGHDVIASVFKWDKVPQKIEELISKGIQVKFRNRFNLASYIDKVKGKVIEKTFAIHQLRAILSFNPDLIIINQGSFVDMEVPLYHRFLLNIEVPYINIVHGNTEGDVLPISSIHRMREIYSKSSRVFFVSNRNKIVAERQLCMRLLNTDIINNPIGFGDATIIPFPQNDTLNLAIVGRIDAKRKGHAALMDILGQENWRSRKWHLNIYGDGPDIDYVLMLCDFYNLRDKVTLHGHVTDLRESIWKNNHMLLMPSMNEGCPISLVEAMICGRPAVVSDVGGNTELIQEGYNGYIADVASPISFGKALERMWASKHKLEEMGKNAHLVALKKLTPDPIENAYYRFLSIINTGRIPNIENVRIK